MLAEMQSYDTAIEFVDLLNRLPGGNNKFSVNRLRGSLVRVLKILFQPW